MKYTELKEVFESVENIEELKKGLEELKRAQKSVNFILIGNSRSESGHRVTLRNAAVRKAVVFFAIKALQKEIDTLLRSLESKGIEL